MTLAKLSELLQDEAEWLEKLRLEPSSFAHHPVSLERRQKRTQLERSRLEKIADNLISKERVPPKVSRSKYSPNECQRAGKR